MNKTYEVNNGLFQDIMLIIEQEDRQKLSFLKVHVQRKSRRNLRNVSSSEGCKCRKYQYFNSSIRMAIKEAVKHLFRAYQIDWESTVSTVSSDAFDIFLSRPFKKSKHFLWSDVSILGSMKVERNSEFNSSWFFARRLSTIIGISKRMRTDDKGSRERFVI